MEKVNFIIITQKNKNLFINNRMKKNIKTKLNK